MLNFSIQSAFSIILTALTVICCSGWRSELNAAEIPARPNVIFILVDDMGFSDLGCYGAEINTPNLDRLAANGVRFTNVHNTSKCFPSRACLLTGLYAQQCGMANSPPGEFSTSVTFADVLKTVGYRTYASGKHHSKTSLIDQGFDRYWGLRDGGCNHFNPGKQRDGEPVPGQKRPGRRTWVFDEKVIQPYTPEHPKFYTTDAFTDYALEFLEDASQHEAPFCLYLSYTAPHDPLHAWDEDIAKYDGVYDVGYEAIRTARYAKQQELGLIDDSLPLTTPTYKNWDSLSDEERTNEIRRMQVYAAMIDRIDQNVGRVLAKLEAMNAFENTLIMFASDNGSSGEVVRLKNQTGPIGGIGRWESLGKNWANVGNTPYRLFKNNSYQGGICTPFIAHWPAGIQEPGRITSWRGHFIDVMATLIDITGGTYPEAHKGEAIPAYEGESFLPSLRNQEQPRHKPIFWRWASGRAIMSQQWKLVSGGKTWELYDTATDRSETSNVADQHPEVVTELITAYEDWANRVGAVGPKKKKAK